MIIMPHHSPDSGSGSGGGFPPNGEPGRATLEAEDSNTHKNYKDIRCASEEAVTVGFDLP